MDLERHFPKTTISHCIISNETQITLHFFEGRISAMLEIRADLILAISETGMCLFSIYKLFFLNFISFLNADQGLKKVVFVTFLKLVKLAYDSE